MIGETRALAQLGCTLVRATLLALALVLLAPDAGRAQEELAPTGIPLAEVAAEADALARQLRQTRDRIAVEEAIEAIDAELQERAGVLAQQSEATTTALAGQITLAKLTELDRDWARAGEDLAGWRRTLTRRVAALEAETVALQASEAVWVATLERAPSDDTPAEVVDVVRRSIEDIKTVRSATRERRSRVLALQNRVAQQELRVADNRDAVRTAREGLRGRLLDPDEPSLFMAVRASDTPAGERIRGALVASVDQIRTYLGDRGSRVVVLVFLFVIVLGATLGLRTSIAARREAGDEISEPAQVFEHPFALASLLTLLCVFWLFPLAPDALLGLVGLVLLLPMLRLLPSLLHAGFRPILYGIAAFYVVDRLRILLESAPLEERLVFAAECAAAALFCVALMRPARMAKIPDPEHFPRWPRRAVRVALGIFTAALIANTLGYVLLAKLLGDGLLTSLYVAIGLYAGVRVLGVVLVVGSKTEWARGIRFLRERRARVVAWAEHALSVIAFLVWVYVSLGAFTLRDPVIDASRAVLTASLDVGNMSVSLGDVLAFVITIVAAFYVARGVRFVLMEDVFSRVRSGRGIAYAAGATAQYTILFGGFLLAVAAAGIDFSRFALLAGAFGVGIGFGLQNVVNNFVSGIILLWERPIQVGDTIDMGELVGEVRRIGIRSSTVRTFAGAEVIVPNADLISQRVINWTLSDQNRRIELPIGVKYGTEPEQVIELLLDVARNHEKVLRFPEPVALFRRHGDSSLDFELRAWVARFDEWFEVESELNAAINHALKAADIEIPFPQRDLHVRSIDADAARGLSGREPS